MILKRPLAILAFLTVTALLYVHQQTLIYQIGERLKENKTHYFKLVDRNKVLVYNVLNLKSPVNLEKRLEKKRIVLNMPKAWEILRPNFTKKAFAKNNRRQNGILAGILSQGKVAEASPVSNL